MSNYTYLVVTNRHSWGKGATEKEAQRNAFQNNYMGKRDCEFVIYHFPATLVSEFWANDMGDICWEYHKGMKPDEDWNPRIGRFRRLKNGHIKCMDAVPEVVNT